MSADIERLREDAEIYRRAEYVPAEYDHLMALLDRLEVAEAKVARVEAIYAAWMAWDGSRGPDGKPHPDASSPWIRSRIRQALDGDA